MNAARAKALSKSRRSTLFQNVEVAAYSRRTEALAYTVTLPGITERWIRKLIKTPRGMIIGQFGLGKTQIAAVQRIVEVELDPTNFWYFFDGDSFARIQQSVIAYKRRMVLQKHQRTSA